MWFAERYHWPAQVVDELPMWIVDCYKPIAELIDTIRAEKQG